MVYTIVIVSSSTSVVQNKHHPMNIIFTILLSDLRGVPCHAWPSILLAIHIALLVVAGNPPHMTMASSRVYTIEKTDMRPSSNIGKACTGSHFTYPKSSRLLSSHKNSCNFETEGHRQYLHALCPTFAKSSHKLTHLHITKRNQHY